MSSIDRDDLYRRMYTYFLTDKKHSDNSNEDDKTFRKETKQEIINRDKKYTELLNHFVSITQVRNILKECFKWLFYLVIMGSIITLTVLTCVIVKKYMSSANIEQIVESMPLLITAIVGFVSTIITIPIAITKYLFSTKEDENITQIILHTQKHDTSGRNWATNFKKELSETKKEKDNQQKTERA